MLTMVRFESEDDLSDAILAAGDSFYHDDLEVPVSDHPDDFAECDCDAGGWLGVRLHSLWGTADGRPGWQTSEEDQSTTGKVALQ